MTRSVWAFKSFFSLIIFCALAGCASAKTAEVCFPGFCYRPQIAETPAEREHGLMGHTGLTENGGMLFVYSKPGRPVFWMKNMKIPLDFIWMNADGEVAAVYENIPACFEKECPQFASPGPVTYVLEIAAGSAAQKNIRRGDKAHISGV